MKRSLWSKARVAFALLTCFDFCCCCHCIKVRLGDTRLRQIYSVYFITPEELKRKLEQEGIRLIEENKRTRKEIAELSALLQKQEALNALTNESNAKP